MQQQGTAICMVQSIISVGVMSNNTFWQCSIDGALCAYTHHQNTFNVCSMKRGTSVKYIQALQMRLNTHIATTELLKNYKLILHHI